MSAKKKLGAIIKYNKKLFDKKISQSESAINQLYRFIYFLLQKGLFFNLRYSPLLNRFSSN